MLPIEYSPKTMVGYEAVKFRSNLASRANGNGQELTPEAYLYTIIGLGHLETKAQLFHEAINRYFHWNQYHMIPIEVHNFSDAISDLQALGLRGLTVTIPYKEHAFKYIEQYGTFGNYETQASGAVNTLVNTDNGIVGWNTDITGFVASSERAKIKLKGIRAAIVGCGGMGRAAVCGLGLKGASQVRLYDIVVDKAAALSEEFKQKYPETQFIPTASIEHCIDSAQYIIQCSPKGFLSPQNPSNVSESAVPRHLLQPFMAVMDAVYVPLKTCFIQDALEQGCHTVVSGEKMVIYGGIEQIQHYHGNAVTESYILIMEEIGNKVLSK